MEERINRRIDKVLYFAVREKVKKLFPFIFKRMFELKIILNHSFNKEILPYLKYYILYEGNIPIACIVWRFTQERYIEILIKEQRGKSKDAYRFDRIYKELKDNFENIPIIDDEMEIFPREIPEDPEIIKEENDDKDEEIVKEKKPVKKVVQKKKPLKKRPVKRKPKPKKKKVIKKKPKPKPKKKLVKKVKPKKKIIKKPIKKKVIKRKPKRKPIPKTPKKRGRPPKPKPILPPPPPPEPKPLTPLEQMLLIDPNFSLF